MTTAPRWLNSFIALALLTCLPALAQVEGPDSIVLAEADNPSPKTLPTIRIVKEKLWGQYFTMVSTRFPNVPDFQCDSWCYESAVDFVDAKALEKGAVEMRHRDQNHPQALIVTTIIPTPGAVTFQARMELDPEAERGAKLPDQPSGLNLCWQLRHAPGFCSAPEKYPAFIKRCFIFTENGCQSLLDLNRRKIPPQPADHEYNNPPWVQSYVGIWQTVPNASPTSWADYSLDRYTTTLIGTVSRDGKYLTALGTDSSTTMCQAWHDCMHNNPQWLPLDANVKDRRWTLTIYAMENDPKALLERFGNDYPNAPHLTKPEKVPAQ